MAPAMPCKTCKKRKHGGTRSKSHDFKSKYACIFEASESTMMRMEESVQNIMRTILQEKGDDSLQHYKLVHKFIPMPQSNEDTRSESSGGQGMGKIGENSGVGQHKSQKQI